jgi:N-formylglutamate amidohydrolase
VTREPWTTETGNDGIIATAIHAGHDLRNEISAMMSLPETDRLREEDPFTDRWVGIAANRVVVNRSRFEVDLNRPREKAIYVVPEDAWGLEIWKEPLPQALVDGSLELYDRFYAEMADLCDQVIAEHGRVLVLDLHSYNHRRNGPDAPVDDPELNPEINLGTDPIESPVWTPVVNRFAQTMAETPFDDAHLDVRANLKFKGGHMSRWINNRYGDRGCSIAIEMKKIYMDEWTGALDEDTTENIGRILELAAAASREAMARM